MRRTGDLSIDYLRGPTGRRSVKGVVGFVGIIVFAALAFSVGTWIRNSIEVRAAAPTIISTSPASGPVAGGTTVTITGTGFLPAIGDLTDVSSGFRHSCGIYLGKAYCWGLNSSGQLGNVSTASSSVPAPVSTTLMSGTVTSISAGLDHTCAIANNRVYCWGSGTSGQLGNSASVNSTVPVAVTTSTMTGNVSAITSGELISCAISVSRAYCWGRGGNGQMGNGLFTTINNAPIAVSTALMPASVTAISSGKAFTCAVSAGRAYCWGNNADGQLGNNATSTGTATPVAVVTTLMSGTVTGVTAGHDSSCAIAANKAYCWGNGANGRLGRNSTTDSLVPVAVNTSLMTGNVSDISAGFGSTADPGGSVCAISDGTPYCWGLNAYGQVGNNSTADRLTPTAAASSSIPTTVTKITAGGTVSCALGADGSAYCWGGNGNGQMGSGGSLIGINAPVSRVLWNVPYMDHLLCEDPQVISDTTLTCVTSPHIAGKVDIRLRSIPYSSVLFRPLAFEFLNPAPSISTIVPDRSTIAGGIGVAINGTNFRPSIADMDKVASGAAHSCGIYQGKAYCWGNNNSGQLGDGSTSDSNVPVAVNTGVMSGVVTEISAGYAGTCAIANSRAYCWGINDHGEAGNNTTGGINSSPVAVSTSLMSGGVTAISAGPHNVCAVASSRAYCWGNNGNGQLGNNTTTQSAVPVAVSTALMSGNVTDVAIGRFSACATATNVYCWGNNGNGQLGTGTLTTSLVPVLTFAASALSPMTEIDGQWESFCSIRSAGAVYCWGRNDYGQRGNGTTSALGTASTPTQVPNPALLSGSTAQISSISVGFTSSCMIYSLRAYCWGGNDNGQLGDGTTTASTLPTLVGPPAMNFASVRSISTNGYVNGLLVENSHTCAVTNTNKAYCWGDNQSGALGDRTNSASNVPAGVFGEDPLVDFDTSTCGVLTLISSSQITCTNPPHTVAVVDVTLTNGDGLVATKDDGFTYYTVPSAPLNLSATSTTSPSAIDMAWQIPATDNLSSITDYRIEYKLSTGSTWTIWTHSPSTNLFATVTGLTTGTAYDFRVAAINEAGTGPYSNTATATPGILAINIVDGLGAPVTNPTYPMGSTLVKTACQTTTGTLGTATQIIRITNSTSNGNWNTSIAATGGSTAQWQRSVPTSAQYAFNDPADGGCNGQLALDATPAVIAPGNSCSTVGIAKGGPAAFDGGVTDSVSLLTAGGATMGDCYYDVTGIDMSQKIPAGQAAGNYSIDMTLTVVAS